MNEPNACDDFGNPVCLKTSGGTYKKKRYILSDIYDYFKKSWLAWTITILTILISISIIKIDNHNHKVEIGLRDETIQARDIEILQLQDINDKLSDKALFFKNRCIELGDKLQELPIKARGGAMQKYCPHCKKKTICTMGNIVRKTLMMWNMENEEDPNITTLIYKCSECNKTFEIKEQYGKEFPVKK